MNNIPEHPFSSTNSDKQWEDIKQVQEKTSLDTLDFLAFSDTSYPKDILIVFEIVQRGKWYSIIWFLKDIPEKYHLEIAKRFIYNQQWAHLAQNIGAFTGVDQDEIIILLIKEKAWWDVAKYFKNFNNLQKIDVYKIIDELIKNGWWRAVAYYLENFWTINYQLVADKLIDSWNGDSVLEYYTKFLWVDPLYIANRLLKTWQVLWEQLAQLLISLNQEEVLVKSLDKFRWLSIDTANHLIKKWFAQDVIENLKAFPEYFNNQDEFASFLISNNLWILLIDKIHSLDLTDYEWIIKLLLKEGNFDS